MSRATTATKRATTTNAFKPFQPRNNDGFSWAVTPDSSMFTRIGYNAVTETLRVEFRNSEKVVEYRGFNAENWSKFFKADSFGVYARQNIFPNFEAFDVR